VNQTFCCQSAWWPCWNWSAGEHRPAKLSGDWTCLVWYKTDIKCSRSASHRFFSQSFVHNFIYISSYQQTLLPLYCSGSIRKMLHEQNLIFLTMQLMNIYITFTLAVFIHLQHFVCSGMMG